MNEIVSTVKTAEEGQGPWDYTAQMPATLDEAAEVYGEENAHIILIGGLKIKLDNAAREAFRTGKSRSEVEEIARNYRPGVATRKNVKIQALTLVTENSARLTTDADLMSRVTEAFTAGKFKDVVAILSEETEEA